MQTFDSQGGNFSYMVINGSQAPLVQPILFWAHGWGQNHTAFLPFVESLKKTGVHYLLDLPGFGESPPPPMDWGTENYADAIAAWMDKQGMPPVIWVGHSFGCRIGLQLAARHPQRISALCLLAGAGLKRKRTVLQRLYIYLRIKLFKIIRSLIPEGSLKRNIMRRFGSADYKNAGVMRNIFIRVVNEDLSNIASHISCPVRLVYGKNDTETPPEYGIRFSTLIPQSSLFVLDGLDHYSILSTGRHLSLKIINDLIKETRK